jgi:hypothetical protein
MPSPDSHRGTRTRWRHHHRSSGTRHGTRQSWTPRRPPVLLTAGGRRGMIGRGWSSSLPLHSFILRPWFRHDRSSPCAAMSGLHGRKVVLASRHG